MLHTYGKQLKVDTRMCRVRVRKNAERAQLYNRCTSTLTVPQTLLLTTPPPFPNPSPNPKRSSNTKTEGNAVW